MSNEIANQLLARVQDEMARNISVVKKQLTEWLERPESGGVDVFRAQLAEVSGGLALLAKQPAAELANAIADAVKTLDTGLYSRKISQADFAEQGAEVASGLLLLSDFISHLGSASDKDVKDVAAAAAVIRSIGGGEVAQIAVHPKIDKETYEVLAARVTEVLDASRNQIEQSAVRSGSSFDPSSLIAQNKELISMFEVLNLPAPQFLLRQVNRLLADGGLKQSQWIDIAEAMILAEETLKHVELSDEMPAAADFSQALDLQGRHSRSLEVRELIKGTGSTARAYYESLRKTLTQAGELQTAQPWADAAKHTMQYSAVCQLVGETALAKSLQQLCLAFAELAQQSQFKPEAFTPMVDALVGAEYIFSDLADTARTNAGDNEFLKLAAGQLTALYPAGNAAKALVQEFIHAEPKAIEAADDSLSAPEDFDELLNSLDALSHDYDGSPIEAAEDIEEEAEILPVINVAAAAGSAGETGQQAQYTAFLGAKSAEELARIGVPPEKSAFLESHADAVMDAEIREFFIEELDEKIAELQGELSGWQAAPQDAAHIGTIRRAFHTIKGSGRTVGYESLGECAWQHEQLLNRVIDKTFPVTPVVQEIVYDTVFLLAHLRQGDDFIEQKGALLTQAAIAERLTAYLTEHPDASGADLHQTLEDIRKSVLAETGSDSAALTSSTRETGGESEASHQESAGSDAAGTTVTQVVHTTAPAPQAAASDDGIFGEPAQSAEESSDNLDELFGEPAAGTEQEASTLADLDSLFDKTAEEPAAASDAETPAGRAPIAGYFAGQTLEDLDALEVPPSKAAFTESHADATDNEDIQSFFLEELDEKIQEIDTALPQWRESPRDQQYPSDIRRAFHTIKGSGRTVGYESLGEFAYQHEQLLNGIIDKHYDTNFLVQDTVEDAVGLLKMLRTDDGFIEHKAALLSQAMIAEKVCESLTQNPGASDQELRELAENLHGAAAGEASDAAQTDAEQPAGGQESIDFDVTSDFDLTGETQDTPAVAVPVPVPDFETSAPDFSAEQTDEPAPDVEIPDFLDFSDEDSEPAAQAEEQPAELPDVPDFETSLPDFTPEEETPAAAADIPDFLDFSSEEETAPAPAAEGTQTLADNLTATLQNTVLAEDADDDTLEAGIEAIEQQMAAHAGNLSPADLAALTQQISANLAGRLSPEDLQELLGQTPAADPAQRPAESMGDMHYRHMAEILERGAAEQPLSDAEEQIIADAFAAQLTGMGLSAKNADNQTEIRQRLAQFAAQQGEHQADYEQLLENVLARLAAGKPAASLADMHYQHMADMLKRSLQMQPLDDKDTEILANSFAAELDSMGVARDDEAAQQELREKLAALAGHAQTDDAAYQQLLDGVMARLSAAPAPLSEADAVRLAQMAKQMAQGGDADSADSSILSAQLREALPEAIQTQAVQAQLQQLLAGDSAAQNVLQQALDTLQAGDTASQEAEDSAAAENVEEDAGQTADNGFIDEATALLEEIFIDESEPEAAPADTAQSGEPAEVQEAGAEAFVDTAAEDVLPADSASDVPVIDIPVMPEFLDAAAGADSKTAPETTAAQEDVQTDGAALFDAETAGEQAAGGLPDSSTAFVQDTDSETQQPSLSSANRPKLSTSSKPSSTERLNQELSAISQHPVLSDAVGAGKPASAATAAVRFLRAVDQFETLSQQLEQESTPEMIDSLIESVYDIEDALDPGGAPDWIWRMLDAIEQLLLSHKAEGSSISLSAASILRQSVDLIEHYENEGSEEEAAQTINSLMSARQQLQPKPSQVIGGEAVVVANEQRWDEWIEDPNAGTELAETFLDEAVALFGRSQLEAERWDNNRSQITHLDTIRRDMHTLKGGARMAGYLAIGDLTHAVESMIESIVDGRSEANSQAGAILNGAIWQGMIMLDSVRDGYLPQTDPYMLNNINRFLGLPLPYPEVAEAELRIKEEEKAGIEGMPVSAPAAQAETVPAAEAASASAQSFEIGNTFDENIDPVLVDIFSDEAQELIDQAESLLADDLKNPDIIEELKRNMHTLKGGARLVGLSAIGDTSHLMESVIEQLPDYNDSKMRQAKNLLNMGHEALYSMLDSVLRQEMPSPARSLNSSLETFAKEGRFVQPAEDSNAASDNQTAALVQESAAQEISAEQDTAVQESVVQETPAVKEPAAQEPAVQEKSAAEEAKVQEQPAAVYHEEAAPVQVDADEALSMPKTEAAKEEPAQSATAYEQELREKLEAAKQQSAPEPAKDGDAAPAEVQRFVRVDANLLDEMIAMIGETAIMRSRMENVSNESEFNLNELTRIATRIDEQMRRLDNETEAQMLFRRENQDHDDEHFDPLEMDRFSEIQQLSRQLAEAIDDLKNVKDTLAHENVLMRNLSTQQGVIQRGIQERLLTTQLIRFDVNEARLKRLVRQTAKSIGKNVNFVLEGGSVELERRLIEDVLPAIEHMIRNSIGHGIEPEQERLAAGKPAEGTVKLIVEAKASNVEIRIVDDGRGFDYDKIREKARSKGWLPPEKEDDIGYLNSLMMRSGFSTAAAVTQLSGRGVGMDVVNEMVKQRRGQLAAASIPGRGAQFTITMPFSMSIAEVLLVEIAGQNYAAPMSAIAAINQIDRADLERSVQGEEVYHFYDGMDYRVYVLGSYFKPRDYEFALEAQTAPALFINAGGEPVALYVDRIANRLEIIVKNVNRQVLNIPGISGATILGDGHVVPVLELLDLSRRIAGLGGSEAEPEPEEITARSVLVVDDSVTMRKVSTRLLERNGYTVETAKDGLDAIDVLQRFTPDLILLDIEMPRMDGFEFAAHVRQNSAVSDVPIIMVTSRTGDKHRERADQIGVQGYLGKPYREDVLIETIESLLGEQANG